MTQPREDWLDDEPVEKPRKRTRKSKAKRRAKAMKELKIEAGTKLPYELARRFLAPRIWGTDGNYVFFRPKRMINGVFTQVANPAAMERHERHIQLGHYVYVGTEDDVQIFRITDISPLKRKFGSVMEMEMGQLKRCAIMSAVKREWTMHVDALEELAYRIQTRPTSDRKGTGALHQNQWAEMLSYIDLQIDMRRGPSAEERGREISRIQSLRRGGSGDGRRILVGV